jgi:hypothetical protein
MIKIKCNYCNKEFEAHNEEQARKLLLVHKINKHPEKMEIKEKK